MKNRKFWRNASLLLGIAAVVAALAIMPMFVDEPATQATSDDKYSVSPPTAGATLVAEVVKYKRQGPLKAQIDADLSTVFHPETATMRTFITAGRDGNLSSISQTVHDPAGMLWFSTGADSSGVVTDTNHRSNTTVTRNARPELLALNDPSDNPSLADMYENLGWTRAGTTNFNGRPVRIYRIASPVPPRSTNPGSGIKLPHTDDLEVASYKTEALIDLDLNMVLKSTRWAVLSDGSEVIVESMAVMKSKVE